MKKTISYRHFHPATAFMVMVFLALGVIGSAQATSLSYNTDGTVIGYSLPGITPAGQPNFENGVSVSWKSSFKIDKKTGDIKSGSATLKATYDGSVFLFNTSPTVADPVTGGKYTLDATFIYNSSTGEFDIDKKHSAKIKGEVTTADGTASKKLFTSTLDSWAYSDSLIGFNTTIDPSSTICTISICTVAESAYLSLSDGGFNPFDYDGKGKYSYTSSGLAVTTIPLPAAVWLFVSGLLGMIGIARRKKAI
jgi:hypothetical protein